jgi:hypothetical protein
MQSKEETPKRIERDSRSRETPDRERGIVYRIQASWADGFKGTSRFAILKTNLDADMYRTQAGKMTIVASKPVVHG